jgi:calcium-dependent protein kinase
MPPEQIEKEAREFFETADVDKNGSLDFGEWSAATINKSNLLNEKNLREAFNMFDRDKSGQIDAQEIADILGGSLQTDKNIWKQIIGEVDDDENGEIDYEEFV